jgi:nitric oxide reductase NorQ protein
LKVDPDFTAIFTSNPEEYAGVHRSQDALRDRMITMDLDHFDYDTELAITQAKAKLSRQDSQIIVNIVRGLRESGKCEFACKLGTATNGMKIRTHGSRSQKGFSHFVSWSV